MARHGRIDGPHRPLLTGRDDERDAAAVEGKPILQRAAVELARWVYGAGKVLPGPGIRRRAEARLLLAIA